MPEAPHAHIPHQQYNRQRHGLHQHARLRQMEWAPLPLAPGAMLCLTVQKLDDSLTLLVSPCWTDYRQGI
jgi:hypothetical protein